MIGRSFDSAGLCVTLPTSWTEYIQTYEVNGGPLHPSGGGGAVSVGSAGLTTSTSYGTGVTTTGSAAGSGFSYTISGIPNPYITLGIKLSALAGAVQVRVYKGTGTSGVQLASANFNYTSPIPTMTVGTSFAPIMTLGTSTTGTITVTVTSVGSYSSSQAMFTVDSLFYTYAQSVHVPVFSTRCGNPIDQYEFGFNGKYKDNEVAGIGNTYNFDARMYNSRIARFFSLDPLAKSFSEISPYSFALNSPITFIDEQGEKAGVYFNHKNKSIIIKTNVYVARGDNAAKSRAENAASFWNSSSEKLVSSFRYTYASNKKPYTIAFDIKVIESNDILKSAINDKIGVSFAIDDEKVNEDERAAGISGKKKENGYITYDGKNIYVRAKPLAENTDEHELGHSMGMPHFLNGVMKEVYDQNDLLRNTIIRGNIQKLIYNINVTSPSNADDFERDNGKGQGNPENTILFDTGSGVQQMKDGEVVPASNKAYQGSANPNPVYQSQPAK